MTAFAELDLVARTEKLEAAVAEIRKIGDAGEQTERRVETSMSKMAKSAARFIAPLAAGLITAFAGRGMVNALDTYENRMLRIDSIITATGGAAGRTSKQLEAQAQSLARATLESVDGIMAAQQTLLTFRNVQGEVFDRAIEGALDLAAAMGGDVRSATMQLARALEDPVRGMTALTRSGTVFTDQQREMVAQMVAAGNTMGAQNFILDELAAQYGGAAGAVSRLAAAKDSLGQSANNLAIAIGTTIGVGDLVAAMFERVDQGVQWLTDAVTGANRGLEVIGSTMIGLASTQIPALVAAIAAKTAGMSAAAIAAGVLSGAMRILGAAVAIAGGPLGLLLGILGGAAAAMILFRDNTATATPIMDDAKDAVDRINSVLATSSEFALPAAARATLALTNENIKLAKSAYAAAEAELAKASAAAQYAQTELGLQQAFSPTGQFTQAEQDLGAQMSRLAKASADLRAAQDGLTARINEGQLALTGAGEAMSEYQRRAIDLTVTMDDLAASVGGGGGGGSGSGADDGFAGRLSALQQQFMTEREVIDAWYNDAQEILADRRAMEILGEEEHRAALLQVEELYQQQLAALRGQSHDQTLSEAATFFGAMASVTQQGGEKLNRVTRALGATQAFINTLVAQSQVLADPTLGFFGKMAAYLAIGSAGLGIVGALRGGGSGGGRSAGGGSRAAASEPTQRARFLRIDVQGDGQFAQQLRDNIGVIVDAVFDESRNGGTTVVVGR